MTTWPLIGQTHVVLVRIRDADPSDLDVLRGIFRRSSLSNEGDRENLLANPETLEFALPTTDGQSRLAVLEDGRIAGFATGLIADTFVELEDLFVDPDCMRHGVGRALVDDIAQMARQHGLGRVEVTANPHASDFYEGTGFVADREVATRFGPSTRMY
jgi:GNAT superfamily N-acetyltransferase